MDRPKRWYGVGWAVGMMLSGIGLTGVVASMVTGDSLIPGVAAKWAFFIFALLLVGTCFGWVWGTYRHFHKFCDMVERYKWMYHRIGELEAEAGVIYKALVDMREGRLPVTDASLAEWYSRLARWDRWVVTSFDNTRWAYKFSTPIGALTTHQEMCEHLQNRRVWIHNAQCRLDDGEGVA